MTSRKMIFDTFIDNPLWDAATWLGVGYLFIPDSPPIFGLYFKHRKHGEDIFRQWTYRLGDFDNENQLRISLVEGPIVGSQPGYNIRIGSNVPTILRLAKEQGINISNTGVFYTSRIHRMNPEPGSQNLRNFKDFYARHGEFVLAQVDMSQNGLIANPASLIRKTEVHIRQIEDILEGDLDRDAIAARPS